MQIHNCVCPQMLDKAYSGVFFYGFYNVSLHCKLYSSNMTTQICLFVIIIEFHQIRQILNFHIHLKIIENGIFVEINLKIQPMKFN